MLDIWYGERAQLVRRAVMNSAHICLECDYFRFCIKGGEIELDRRENFVSVDLLRGSQPTIVGETSALTFMEWRGCAYAVYKGLGSVDLRLGIEGVFEGTSRDEVARARRPGGCARPIQWNFSGWRRIPGLHALSKAAGLRAQQGG